MLVRSRCAQEVRPPAINIALLKECGRGSWIAGYKHRTPKGVRERLLDCRP
jgi:hypothetical protein